MFNGHGPEIAGSWICERSARGVVCGVFFVVCFGNICDGVLRIFVIARCCIL